MKKVEITTVQLAYMALGSALVFPYTFMPILNTPPANQDAWIVLVLSILYLIILNGPLLFFINRFKGKKATDILELVLGKTLGKIGALYLVSFFLICQTACTLIIMNFIRIHILQKTPYWALLLYIFVPVCFGSYKGSGTIARLSTLLVPVMQFTIIVFFLLGIDNMKLSRLLPVISDSTLIELNIGAFLTATRYSEILIFFVFGHLLSQKGSIKKSYLINIVLFLVSFMLMLFPTILVLGVDFAKNTWNPYYLFSRQVETYEFIQRVQAFNILAWFPVVLLKLMLNNFMGSFVLSEISKKKNHRSFVIPLAMVTYLLSLIPFLQKSSTLDFLKSDAMFPYLILPYTFVFPVILLIVYWFRRKKISAQLEEEFSSNDKV